MKTSHWYRRASEAHEQQIYLDRFRVEQSITLSKKSKNYFFDHLQFGLGERTSLRRRHIVTRDLERWPGGSTTNDERLAWWNYNDGWMTGWIEWQDRGTKDGLRFDQIRSLQESVDIQTFCAFLHLFDFDSKKCKNTQNIAEMWDVREDATRMGKCWRRSGPHFQVSTFPADKNLIILRFLQHLSENAVANRKSTLRRTSDTLWSTDYYDCAASDHGVKCI